MGADPEPPANAITVTLKRKPVPKKVPTGNPDRPFEYVETTLADNAECGIGISFFIGDDGWPVIKEIGEKGSAHDCPDMGVGDMIYSVDNKTTRKHTVAQVVHMIKGTVGSEVKLSLGKNKNPPPAKPAQPAQPADDSQPTRAAAPPSPKATRAAPPPPPQATRAAPPPDRDDIVQPPPREREQDPEVARRAREEEERRKDQQKIEAEMAAQAEKRRQREEQMKEMQRVEEQVQQQQVEQQAKHNMPSQLLGSAPQNFNSTLNSTQNSNQAEARGNEDGFCVKKWPDGKLYRGEMKAGRRHGQGSITYPDGASYEGEWRDDGRHGIGEYRYTDGTWYKGQWVNGNREGEGLCTYSDGNMYQGEWLRNLPHGSGKCRFADGSVYKGDFQNGRMHGVGTLFRHDGAVEFHGHWKDGEKLRPMAADGNNVGDPSLSMMSAMPDSSFQLADQTQNTQQTRGSMPPGMPPPDDPSAPPIKLFVTFQGASHLPKTPGPDSVPSAYMVASVGAQTHITKTLPPSFEPRWEREVAEFNVPPGSGRQPLVVRLFGWHPVSSQQLGEATVPLRDLTPFGTAREISVPLLRSDDGTKVWGHDSAGAVVHLLLQARANGNNLAAPVLDNSLLSTLPSAASAPPVQFSPAPPPPQPQMQSYDPPPARGYVPLQSSPPRESAPQQLFSPSLNSFERSRPDHVPITHYPPPSPTATRAAAPPPPARAAVPVEVRRVSLQGTERVVSDVDLGDRYYLLESSTDPRLSRASPTSRAAPAPLRSPEGSRPLSTSLQIPKSREYIPPSYDAPQPVVRDSQPYSPYSQTFARDSRPFVREEPRYVEPYQAPRPLSQSQSRPLSQSFDGRSSMRDTGVRCGVGLKISQNSAGNIVVDKIQKDSAADVDGQIKIGDMLVKVDGSPLDELWQAKELLLGAPDTMVTIDAARQPPGKPLKTIQTTLRRRNLSIDRSSTTPSGAYNLRASSSNIPSTSNVPPSSSGGQAYPAIASRYPSAQYSGYRPASPTDRTEYITRSSQPATVRRAVSPPRSGAYSPANYVSASTPSRSYQPSQSFTSQAPRSPSRNFNPWQSASSVTSPARRAPSALPTQHQSAVV